MTALLPITRNCERIIRNPPREGEGRHNWMFRVAASMHHGANWKLEKVREYLETICDIKGWHDRKGKTIDDIITKLDAGMIPTDFTRLPPWPERNDAARQDRFNHAPMFDPNGDTGLTAAHVLTQIYRHTDLVCFGWSIYRFSTMPLNMLLPSAHNAEYIVANVMSAEIAPNGSKRNKQISTHPDHRRFAIVEFDTKETREQQTGVLSSLHSPDTPLVMAVWSGGKSIHAWYNVSSLTPYQKLRFFRFAVYLGADQSLFDMSKLVRMPGGKRSTGQRQSILFWEPEYL